MKTTRMLLGLTAAALPLLGAPAITASPASAAGNCTFTPLSLTANVIDDPWPDSQDEIRFDYGTQSFRANGVTQGRRLSGMASETFGTELHIELWELDTGHWPNPDDKLGQFDIGGYTQLNNQRTFTGDGANYLLTFSVQC